MSSMIGSEETYSRPSTAYNKGLHSWEDGTGYPRSPLANDEQHQQHQQARSFSRQRAGASSLGMESSSKPSKATTLSNLHTSRGYTGRQSNAERGVSVAISQHRSPYPSSSKFFLTVVPPLDLPHDPPHPRSQASTSSGSHIRRGTLLPLYPTLGGQLYAISREYGLPSIGGLALYLCDDGDGNLGPRVGDAAWSALWSRFFDEAADDLYQDITSPIPAFRSARDPDRRCSGSSSEVQSPFADHSIGANGGLLRRDPYDGNDDSYQSDNRRPSSSMKRSLGNGYPASPMAYHTPSPHQTKYGNRSQSRSSFHHSPIGTQARLPIVGRIEWAVDKNRAPWWSNWIGEAIDLSSERSVSSVVTNHVSQSTLTKKGPARRSMHLASSLSRPRAESSARSIPVKEAEQFQLRRSPNGRTLNEEQGIKVYGAPDGTLSGESEEPIRTVASSVNLNKENNVDNDAMMGYQPIIDQERDSQDAKSGETSFDNVLTIDTLPVEASQFDEGTGEISYENQSYAGYSALLGVDDEARVQDTASSSKAVFVPESFHLDKSVVPNKHHFNVNILQDSDEGNWGKLQQDVEEERDGAILPDRLSARSLVEQSKASFVPKASAVHEWIAKTQSPNSKNAELMIAEDDDEEEEELLPPQNDVEEVLGLWAEKTRELHSPQSATVIQSAGSSLMDQREREHLVMQRDGKGISTTSSRASQSESSHSKQSPQIGGLARMVTFSQEAPPPKAVINKASLLSPIALDHSPSTFAGPVAELGNLLGTRNTLGPHDKQVYSLASRQSTVDTLPTPVIETHDQYGHPLSSPRLELPSPRSPGAHSQRSSSTDASDALLDMERALALLSPAVSHNNQDSPAMGTSTGDSTYDSGTLASAMRVRIPTISSKESMEKAKTLSTSVTPSPRWFRNTTMVTSQLPRSAFVDLTSIRNVSGPDFTLRHNEGEGEAINSAVKISPRPASAFASAKYQDRLITAPLQPPPSAVRLTDSIVGQGHDNVEDVVEHENHSPREQQGDKREEKTASFTKEKEEAHDRSADLGPNSTTSIGIDPVMLQSTDGSANHPRLTILEHDEATQLYDSPIEVEESNSNKWLQPSEQLGRQGWSADTSVDNSRGNTTRDNTLHEGEEVQNQAFEEVIRSSPAISASFSPRSGEYATVGVQAEREDVSRTESLFSLVSDDAPTSESPHSFHRQGEEEEEEEGEEDVEGAATKDLASTQNNLATPTFDQIHTPQMGFVSNQIVHPSSDFQPSIHRLIRGNSFAESSEASSSKAHSPYLGHGQKGQDSNRAEFDWANVGVVTMAENEEKSSNGAIIKNDTQTKSLHGDDDAMTMTRGSFDDIQDPTRLHDGEEWSQSGSDYDDDNDTTSPATRMSRISGYSDHLPHGLSDAGGRTPTFFYDSHLTDEEQPSSRRQSKRLSGNRRGSKTRSVQRISRPVLRSLDAQDALGVGLMPTNQSTISSSFDREGLMVQEGTMSVDSSRHDVVSLAGEMLNSNDDRMLSGFERVSHPQETMQDAINSRNVQAGMNGENYDGSHMAEEQQQQMDLFPVTPIQFDSMTQGSNFNSPLNKGVPASLRRSMGSIRDDKREYQKRRASASATSSPGKQVLHSGNHYLTSPRRLKGAMLRLGAEGSSLVRGTSPNSRFRALPPSPNLPPKGVNGGLGDPMSPISPSFMVNEAVQPLLPSTLTFRSPQADGL